MYPFYFDKLICMICAILYTKNGLNHNLLYIINITAISDYIYLETDDNKSLNHSSNAVNHIIYNVFSECWFYFKYRTSKTAKFDIN
jgi:hypothetical protein